MPPKAKTKRAAKDRRPKRKPWSFCTERAIAVSYRDVGRLRKFVSERARSCPAGSPATARSTSGC